MAARFRVSAYLRNRFVFYREAVLSARQTGAFSYTSRAVARAVTAAVAREGDRPIRVLEVGAGTGALTRAILARLGPGDRLDAYEINPAFARVLRAEIAGARHAPGVEVRVFEADIETLPEGARYDRIVSTLPLLNMEPEKVRRVFALLLGRLEPGGTLTYYDYWAKQALAWLPFQGRARVRAVLGVTREFLDRHEVAREWVPWNLPPAVVHHLRASRNDAAAAGASRADTASSGYQCAADPDTIQIWRTPNRGSTNPG